MFLFKQIKLVLPGIGSVLDDSGAWDQVEWCPVSRVHRVLKSTVSVVINSPSGCE